MRVREIALATAIGAVLSCESSPSTPVARPDERAEAYLWGIVEKDLEEAKELSRQINVLRQDGLQSGKLDPKEAAEIQHDVRDVLNQWDFAIKRGIGRLAAARSLLECRVTADRKHRNASQEPQQMR